MLFDHFWTSELKLSTEVSSELLSNCFQSELKRHAKVSSNRAQTELKSELEIAFKVLPK